MKDRALCLSKKKSAVQVVFKRKLHLKNSINLVKKKSCGRPGENFSCHPHCRTQEYFSLRSRKRITAFISNEDMNDIIKIIKSLEDSNVLIDGIIETVKHKIKKTRRWISSCLVNTISR